MLNFDNKKCYNLPHVTICPGLPDPDNTVLQNYGIASSNG